MKFKKHVNNVDTEIYRNFFINKDWLTKNGNEKFYDFYSNNKDKIDSRIENSIFVKRIKSEYLKWERKQKIEKIIRNED
jgi:hypothetical protein